MSRKGLSVRTEPNMTLADLERLRSMHLCKKNFLGFVNGFSDPYRDSITMVYEAQVIDDEAV